MGGSGGASTQITAGLGGFLTLFGMGIACYFLFRSMNNRLRGVRYRQEQEIERQQQEAAQRASSGRDSDGDDRPGDRQ